MRALGYVHPYDERGKRRGVDALPASVMGMRDDPYRSLAAFARQSGAYRKPPNARGDFRWAGFLRERIEEDMGSIGGFALALTQADPVSHAAAPLAACRAIAAALAGSSTCHARVPPAARGRVGRGTETT
ncbi:ParB-like protein [Cupriavidus basilensis]